MSSVPENTNYQQQVIGAESAVSVTPPPGPLHVPVLLRLPRPDQRLSGPRGLRVRQRGVGGRSGREGRNLHVSLSVMYH